MREVEERRGGKRGVTLLPSPILYPPCVMKEEEEEEEEERRGKSPPLESYR